MNRKKLLSLLFLYFYVSIPPSSALGLNAENNFQKFNEKVDTQDKKEVKVLLSAGGNISKYISEMGDWQFGYRLGLTFIRNISSKIEITIPFSYIRTHAMPEKVKGKSYANDGNIYRTFVDRDIAVGFIELPLLFSYNVYSAKTYNLHYLFGPGLVIAAKDYSKLIEPKDVTITDEIIGTHNFPLDPVETRFTIPNSGLNVNTGIRFNVSRFYFDLLYVLYPYDVKEINKVNSISFIVHVDIG